MSDSPKPMSKVQMLTWVLQEEARQFSMQEVIKRRERQARYLAHDRELVSSLEQAYGQLPGVQSKNAGNYDHSIISGSRA